MLLQVKKAQAVPITAVIVKAILILIIIQIIYFLKIFLIIFLKIMKNKKYLITL